MQKQRVSRACDTCKRRKIRCTGKLPCAHCVKNNKTCEFTAAYTRGAVPEVQPAPLEEQEKYLEEVRYTKKQVRKQSLTVRNSSHVNHVEPDNDDERETTTSTGPSSRINSSLNHQNQSTVYQRLTNINNLADACLYERTQSNLNRQSDSQKNPVYAHGDPPLPEIDSSFLIVPPENIAQALVGKYFGFVAATNRFLHQPTVDTWTSQLLKNTRSAKPNPEQSSHHAVVLMVFASAHEYMSEEYRESDVDISFYYFQAAESQLSKETGKIRLSTLQARLLQCMYLLSRSRINQCYSIFGTLVNYIYALGIHRKENPSKKSNILENEMQKRIFWCTYVADKYLSSALGRPQMLRDEDIDQELPLIVDDKDLSSHSLQKLSLDTQTPMRGAISQIRLAQIISNILRELYSVQKSSFHSRFISAGRLNEDLCKWRKEVAPFVDLEPSALSPMYARQNLALRLAYSQARIILYRPFLIDNFDVYSGIDILVMREKQEEKVNGCLDAALNLAAIINTMYKMEISFNASWFAHFCGYTATVALFVHIIKRCTSESPITPVNPHREISFCSLVPYFNAATKCQEQIKNSSTMTKESFAQKCSIVLAELTAEAAFRMKQLQSKESRDRGQSEQAGNQELPPREEIENAGIQLQVEDLGFLGEEWNDLNVDQPVTSSYGVYAVSNGLDGYRDGTASGSLVDRIDRWGFSSLTGY